MDDKPKDRVDFAAAKAVRFEVALEALGLMGSLRRDGEQLQGVCPLHKASGDKESFGVHTGKHTCNCFARKKHGTVLDFVMQVKGIGAKDAAVWLLSLVDKGEGQERVQVAAAAGDGGSVVGSGAAVVQEAALVAATSLPTIEGLTAREAWLVAVIAQGVAWYLAETFKQLSDTGTIEKCIVAKVAIAAGIEQVREGGNDVESQHENGTRQAALRGEAAARHGHDGARQQYYRKRPQAFGAGECTGDAPQGSNKSDA